VAVENLRGAFVGKQPIDCVYTYLIWAHDAVRHLHAFIANRDRTHHPLDAVPRSVPNNRLTSMNI